MNARQTMNTESLQKRFPGIYANFMVANDLVVGANYSIPWGGAVVGHRSKYLRTFVKVPLACHVGMKLRNDRKITFGTVTSFDVTKGGFESCPYQKTNPEHAVTSELIRAFLDGKKYPGGMDISILSETTRGHGLGYSGVSAAAIATALMAFTSGKNDKGAGSGHAETFKLAWKLEYAARYGNTIGEGVHLALSEASVAFHCCSQFGESLKADELASVKHYVRHLSSRGGGALRTSDLPIDFCLVYAGHPTDTRQVELFRSADRRSLDGCAKTLRDAIFGRDVPDDVYVAGFAEGKSPYDSVQEALVVLNVRAMESFVRIAERGFDKEAIEDLVDNANQYRNVLAVAEKQDNFAERLVYAFNVGRAAESERIGIVPCYTGKSGGGYVVVFRPGSNRNALEKAVESVRSHYPDACLEYCSWLDGDAYAGPTIEHWPTMEKISPLLPKDCATFRDNLGAAYLGSYNDILEREKNCLLLDAVEMKLAVMGARPTSKDIPSQSVAVEVLSKLLLRPGEDVHNAALPASSYSKDRGLLMSKALMPLMHYVKSVTGKDLPITCQGSSGKFSVSLGKTDLRIGLITQ